MLTRLVSTAARSNRPAVGRHMLMCDWSAFKRAREMTGWAFRAP